MKVGVWNEGNDNSFPLESCRQMLVLEEKKNPLLSLVFVSFALAREKLTRQRDKRTANDHNNGRIGCRTAVSAWPPHVRPPHHAAHARPLCCLCLAAASLQAASPALAVSPLCAACVRPHRAAMLAVFRLHAARARRPCRAAVMCLWEKIRGERSACERH